MSKKLEQLEKKLQGQLDGLKKGMVQSFHTLAEIHESGEWKSEKHKTWGDYCQLRWGFSRQRGYQILESAEILKQLPEKCQINLTSESAVRALKEAPPEKRVEVMEKATKDGKAKAKDISREVKKLKSESVLPLDEIGREIPEEILEDYRRAEEFNHTLKKLHEVKLAIEHILDADDIIFVEVGDRGLSDAKHLHHLLKNVIPYSVCTTCSGLNRKKCNLCKGRGFISKFAFDSYVPIETKELIRKSVGK